MAAFHAALLVVLATGPARAVVNGDADEAHPSVVAILRRTPVCTGVVVGERAVLTAAHCFPDAHDEDAALALRVAVGSALLPVRAIHVDPAFDVATFANDLAILELDAPAPVPVLAIDATPPSDGAELVLSGFGARAAPRLAARTSGVVRLAGARIANGHVHACHGDSGAPLLGERGVVALVSSGDDACVEATRVTPLAPHLDRFVKPTVERMRSAPPPPAPARRDSEGTKSGLAAIAFGLVMIALGLVAKRRR